MHLPFLDPADLDPADGFHYPEEPDANPEAPARPRDDSRPRDLDEHDEARLAAGDDAHTDGERDHYAHLDELASDADDYHRSDDEGWFYSDEA